MESLQLLLIFLVGFSLRWFVSLCNYSGYNTSPLYGDYEAQRHWMEITTSLPLQEWYFPSEANDLSYWGLDYPPLTAYFSYFVGKILCYFDQKICELYASRGYESYDSKILLRSSVLLADLLLFFPAIYQIILLYQKFMMEGNSNSNSRNMKSNRSSAAVSSSAKTAPSVSITSASSLFYMKYFFLCFLLFQPSFILIDHGHFQYNNISLGLTLLAITFIGKGRIFLGSFFYTLALNYKQMSLYYAPAFTFYLLGECIHNNNNQKEVSSKWKKVLRILLLGLVVITTFIVMFLPFCIYTPEDKSCIQGLHQVLHRIFPVARGLFEDKVANIWVCIDILWKMKRHLSNAVLLKICTISTTLAFLPSIIDLVIRKPTFLRFILSLFISSMAFFLFSFQVHEKTILFPLLPLSLLANEIPLLVGHFGCVSCFSMFFLLQKDGLEFPFVILITAFYFSCVWPYLYDRTLISPFSLASSSSPPFYLSDGKPRRCLKVFVIISTVGMILLYALQALISPPNRYPHLFQYFVAIYACGHFIWYLVYCIFWQCTNQESHSHLKIA